MTARASGDGRVPSRVRDPRVPARAGGLLAEFSRAGVLGSADVHVAARLAALAGEDDERVALAAALAVRAVRHGSVCVDLAVAAQTVDVDVETDVDGAASGSGDGTGPEEAGAPAVALAWPAPADWVAACAGSPLVDSTAGSVGDSGDSGDSGDTRDQGAGADPATRPLHLAGTRLYLDRYWEDERLVADQLGRRMAAAFPAAAATGARAVLDGAFADAAARDQRAAAEAALRLPLTVITGGPGTGKTRTLAGLLAALLSAPGAVPRIGLAAPTGRATARLSESIHAQAGEAWAAPVARELTALRSRTLHRLLGPLPGTRSRFRHDRRNHLPYDVVVVDETSMVSLPLMARLLEAVRPDARVILVGDPDQLSSVEAGAVLRDVVDLGDRRGPDGPVRRLHHNFRTGAARLHALAAAVRAGDPDAVIAELAPGGEAELVDVDLGSWGAGRSASLAAVRRDVVEVGREVARSASQGDAATTLRRSLAHRMLCGRRTGPFGAQRWAEEIERWLDDAGIHTRHPGWPPPRWPIGTPVVVTANDDDNGLANGDAGVVVARTGPDGTPGRGITAAFEGQGGVRLVHPDRVAYLRPAHTITIHKAQGGEYDAVTVMLPPRGSPLLTRELLYTALTRARTRVRVVGTEAAVRTAVTTQARRAGGLTAP
ncbi:MAG: exodeoxyribonuclease V subunit alpha [Actinomycetales bacterium]